MNVGDDKMMNSTVRIESIHKDSVPKSLYDTVLEEKELQDKQKKLNEIYK